MVKAPWRRAPKAALWKGQAPQVATGRAMAATSHCQPGSWRAGTMEIAMTGMDRIRLTMRRPRRSAARVACEAPMRVALAGAAVARSASAGADSPFVGRSASPAGRPAASAGAGTARDPAGASQGASALVPASASEEVGRGVRWAVTVAV